jgi:hypothetical protein
MTLPLAAGLSTRSCSRFVPKSQEGTVLGQHPSRGPECLKNKKKEPEFDLEAAELAIEACDGDLRAAARSLIAANDDLTQVLEYGHSYRLN